VKLSRLRIGELAALVGAICLIVALLLPWYDDVGGDLGAWSTFGPAVVLLMSAAAAGLLLTLATVTERSPALPVAASIWSIFLGLIAVIAALVRLLERPGQSSSPAIGAWLALVGALLVLIGSWQSIRDERTELYPKATPEPRRAPGPGAAPRS
jgi:peptidoglycan/LPS O-acetylase OafA/YrhL